MKLVGMMTLLLVGFVFLNPSIGQDAKKDTPKKEPAKKEPTKGSETPKKADSSKETKKVLDPNALIGKWVLVSGTKNGAKITGDSMKAIVNITKDKIQLLNGDNVEHEMTYTLNTKKSPVEIDMKGTKGPAENMSAPGIIKYKDSELHLCYAVFDGKRPTKFETTMDSKSLYFVMKNQNDMGKKKDTPKKDTPPKGKK